MGKKGAKSNPAAVQFASETVERLLPVGDVKWRSMFGGNGIFESGDMFAIVDSSSGLYFKADETTRARYEAAGSRQHSPMPYFEVPAEVADDDTMLVEWAVKAVEVAHRNSKKN